MPGRPSRGQAVLAAAVVVATALAPMAAAYLQLGYPANAAAVDADRASSDAADVRRQLSRTTTAAAARVAGTAWSNRSRAVAAATDALGTGVAAAEAVGARRDTTRSVAANATLARRVAREECPTGPSRRFGSCVADGGVVLQRRAGEATLVAAAVDVVVVTPRSRTTASFVLRPRGGGATDDGV